MMCCVAVWLQCMCGIYTYIYICKEILMYVYVYVFIALVREGTAVAISSFDANGMLCFIAVAVFVCVMNVLTHESSECRKSNGI